MKSEMIRMKRENAKNIFFTERLLYIKLEKM